MMIGMLNYFFGFGVGLYCGYLQWGRLNAALKEANGKLAANKYALRRRLELDGIDWEGEGL